MAISVTPTAKPHLADGIGVACFGDAAIVLDLHRDRYRRMGGDAGKLLAALGADREIDPADPLLDALEARGMVSRAVTYLSPWLSPNDLPPPEQSVLEGGEQVRPLVLTHLGVVLACAMSRWDLRHLPLAGLLQALPTHWRGRSLAELVTLAREFDRARRLAPFTPRCLPDTLAFVRRARRRGHPVHLVFGVKLHPFEAHCWAQSGTLVLTDPLERVRRFQPLLAV